MDEQENFDKSPMFATHPFQGELQDFTNQANMSVNQFIKEQTKKVFILILDWKMQFVLF